MTIKQVCQKAIKKWGQDAQLIKTIEELSELSKALCKYLNSDNNVNGLLDNIAEEIADVEIMIEQLKIIFDNADKVLFVKFSKIKRLEGRVKE